MADPHGRMSDHDPVLIWSNEHRAWWNANHRGYTTNTAGAGVYLRHEAEDIVRNAYFGWQPGQLPPEVIVPTGALLGTTELEDLAGEMSRTALIAWTMAHKISGLREASDAE